MPTLQPRPPAILSALLRDPTERGMEYLIDRVERIMAQNRPTKRGQHPSAKVQVGKSA